MRNQSKSFTRRIRATIAAVALSGVMVGALGVAVSSSGATTMRTAGESSYCRTLMSFFAVKGAPSAKDLTAYHKWVLASLPRFQKLESEAPNASVKKVLGQLVTMMQNQSNIANLKKLDQSIAANGKQWANDFKVFISTTMSCIKNLSSLY